MKALIDIPNVSVTPTDDIARYYDVARVTYYPGGYWTPDNSYDSVRVIIVPGEGQAEVKHVHDPDLIHMVKVETPPEIVLDYLFDLNVIPFGGGVIKKVVRYFPMDEAEAAYLSPAGWNADDYIYMEN